MDLTGMPLSDPNRTSIIIIAACGLLSGVTTVGLLVYLFWSAYGWRYNGPHNGFRSFLNTEAGRYLVSLLFADLCHCLGYSSGLRWIMIGKIDLGAVCTFQAVLLQLGDMGTVLWVFAISVHTLTHLFLSKRPPPWLAPAMLGFGWLIIILLPIIGPHGIADKEHPFFDGGSGLWCWVSSAYPRTQVLYFFVWAMVSLVGSVICYTLVYLRTAGYVSGGRYAPAMPRQRGRSSRWACVSAFGHDSSDQGTDSAPKSSSGGTNQNQGQTRSPRMDPKQKIGRDVRKVARKLLLYPVAYAVLVMPLTISSLGSMAGWHTPLAFLVASTGCYALGGLVDSLLFIFTRRSFIRNATSVSSRSRSRHAGGDTRRFDGITVTRHELTVFDIPTLEGTESLPGDPSKADDMPTPVEKALDDRAFGAYIPYSDGQKLRRLDSESDSSPRAQ